MFPLSLFWHVVNPTNFRNPDGKLEFLTNKKKKIIPLYGECKHLISTVVNC